MREFSLETRINLLTHKYDFRFNKSLGQNFLIKEEILAKIAETACLNKKDNVLEIGPGMGFLTEKLSQQGGLVTAVEIDNKLVTILKELFQEDDNIIIRQDDALKLNFPEVQKETKAKGFSEPFKIVANLPYYITTPLLFHFLDNAPYWQEMVLMVQKEVADRITASPGTKDYGVLTLMVAYYAHSEKAFTVPAEDFRPQPKVDSAVVHLTKREAPPAPIRDQSTFQRVVKAGFGQRRKTLANALANSGLGLTKDDTAKLLEKAGIEPKRRGETLSFKEYANLANLLYAGKNNS